MGFKQKENTTEGIRSDCDVITTNRYSIDHYYYLVSISSHKKNIKVTKSELEAILFVLKYVQKLDIINKAYETSGLYQQLHLHLVVRSLERLNYKQYSSHKGFQIRYDFLNTQSDLHRAQVYVAKEQYDSFNPEGVTAIPLKCLKNLQLLSKTSPIK